MSDPEYSEEVRRQRERLTLTLMVCGIVIALGLVVAWNYMRLVNRQAQETDYLPVLMRLDKPLKGRRQDGEPVSFAELRGKVWVLGYVYTRCPAGCSGVMGVMKELQEEFGDHPDFHLVALTLDPEKDTAEWMAQWAKERDMGGNNWWFMTGGPKEIRSYMGKYFRMTVEKREDPEKIKIYGEWEHGFKLVLVDQSGAIRYYYEVLDARFGDQQREKLSRDVQRLLDEGPEVSGPRG